MSTPVRELVPDAYLQSLMTTAGSIKASVKSAPATSASFIEADMRFAFVKLTFLKLLFDSFALVASTFVQSEISRNHYCSHSERWKTLLQYRNRGTRN